jgi:ankyrin repeat protein
MKNVLKEFKNLIEENDDYPKDELRDYYLMPAKELLSKNPQIANEILDEKSALMMVVEQIVLGGHHIRISHLNNLAWDLIDLTPKTILNYQNKEKNSVIHLTCDMECFSVGLLDFMKEKGANFSLINANGETPLILVSACDSLDDIKFIHGYTNKNLINYQEKIHGYTALHKAVKYKKINNIFFLLESGASVYIKDNNGMIPIDYLTQKEGTKKTHLIEEIKGILSAFAAKENADKTIKEFSQKK